MNEATPESNKTTVPPVAEWESTRIACCSHAQDLTKAASLVFDAGYWNVAYHLAALALEEIGKVALLVASSCPERDTQDASKVERRLSDHVTKLFWALWSPLIGQELITLEQVDRCRGLAGTIHARRLDGLYVNTDTGAPPRDAIAERDARELLSLAQSRLELASTQHYVTPPRRVSEDMSWLAEAGDDPELRQFCGGRNPCPSWLS
jgi:AbiV family abortive infection protein